MNKNKIEKGGDNISILLCILSFMAIAEGAQITGFIIALLAIIVCLFVNIKNKIKQGKKMNKNKIEKIAKKYGLKHQIAKTIEELNELLNELETPSNRERIVDEIADCKIMLQQLIFLFNIKKEVKNRTKFKLNRQIERIG